MQKNWIFIQAILISLLASTFGLLIIPPLKTEPSYEAGLIYLQGANIIVKDYVKFSRSLQDKFNGRLWIALVDFPLDLPEPLLVDSIIFQTIANFRTARFNVTQDTPIFFAGHSLGGATIQNYIINNATIAKLPVKVAGLILLGAFVTRNNRETSLQNFVPPILTLGAELDGLCRITRMAESFYFNKNNNERSGFNLTTIVIPGMNHYQFSGEGEPPSFVQKNDLRPEVNNEEARDRVTSVINAFIQVSLKRETDQDIAVLNDNLQTTKSLVQPIIDAFLLEGSYHLKQPCLSKSKSLKDANCSLGSHWTESAQKVLGGAQFSYNVTDTFRVVYKVPEKFPSLNNKCVPPTPCVLSIDTVTELVYSIEDSFDTGLQPVAASEMRSKLISKQAVILAATGKKLDFNETDFRSCGDLNVESLRWAISIAPATTVRRYLKEGVQLTFGNDVNESAGPLWIWTALSFNRQLDPVTNNTIVSVQSPTLKFPVDYFITSFRGFHYCKLLSPARALEWLYVDSLKP